MSDRPWLKFYPRDWRGDQALRAVSIAARGLWMEMLCVMHEATPYGHLMLGVQPVSDAVLSRLAGVPAEEVQALLVELRDARVFRQTRSGVIYSKRMTDDHKRSIAGRNAKKTALEQGAEISEEKPAPSSPSYSTPSTQRPEAKEQKVDGGGGVREPEGARVIPIQPAQPDDWPDGDLAKTLIELAGSPWLDRDKSPGLVTTAGRLAAWRREGLSWEHDVVPVVTQLCRNRRQPISTWKFFDQAMERLLASNREALNIPEVQAHGKRSHPDQRGAAVVERYTAIDAAMEAAQQHPSGGHRGR